MSRIIKRMAGHVSSPYMPRAKLSVNIMKKNARHERHTITNKRDVIACPQ